MTPQPTRLASLIGLACLLLLLTAPPAASYQVEPAPVDADKLAGPLMYDCFLTDGYNFCSGWIWVFADDPGAVWGAVMDPNNCVGGCLNGGGIEEVTFYSRCSSVPGAIGGINVETVDSRNCLVDLLYHSGPMTITHCVSGDRWTTVPLPRIHLFGNPFALTIEWGPGANPQFATDNALANLYCGQGHVGFPGCRDNETCVGWVNARQVTYIYFTDLDDNGTLEDLCALYGEPYSLAFPYVYHYWYMSNNLIMSVGLDCGGPWAVEPSSWGRVKALFD